MVHAASFGFVPGFSNAQEYSEYLTDLAKPKLFNCLVVDSQRGLRQTNVVSYLFIKLVDVFTAQSRTSSKKLASAAVKLLNFGVEKKWVRIAELESVKALAKKIDYTPGEKTKPGRQRENLEQIIARVQQVVAAASSGDEPVFQSEKPMLPPQATVEHPADEPSSDSSSYSEDVPSDDALAADDLSSALGTHSLALIDVHVSGKKEPAGNSAGADVSAEEPVPLPVASSPEPEQDVWSRATIIKAVGTTCLVGLIAYLTCRTNSLPVPSGEDVTEKPADFVHGRPVTAFPSQSVNRSFTVNDTPDLPFCRVEEVKNSTKASDSNTTLPNEEKTFKSSLISAFKSFHPFNGQSPSSFDAGRVNPLTQQPGVYKESLSGIFEPNEKVMPMLGRFNYGGTTYGEAEVLMGSIQELLSQGQLVDVFEKVVHKEMSETLFRQLFFPKNQDFCDRRFALLSFDLLPKKFFCSYAFPAPSVEDVIENPIDFVHSRQVTVFPPRSVNRSFAANDTLDLAFYRAEEIKNFKKESCSNTTLPNKVEAFKSQLINTSTSFNLFNGQFSSSFDVGRGSTHAQQPGIYKGSLSEYLEFVEKLDPSRPTDAVMMLAGKDGAFDRELHAKDPKKYANKLFKQRALHIHPDKCSLEMKKACTDAMNKLQVAKEVVSKSVSVCIMSQVEIDENIKGLRVNDADFSDIACLFPFKKCKSRSWCKAELDIAPEEMRRRVHLLSNEQVMAMLERFGYGGIVYVKDEMVMGSIQGFLSKEQLIYVFEKVIHKKMSEDLFHKLFFSRNRNLQKYRFSLLSAEQFTILRELFGKKKGQSRSL